MIIELIELLLLLSLGIVGSLSVTGGSRSIETDIGVGETGLQRDTTTLLKLKKARNGLLTSQNERLLKKMIELNLLGVEELRNF